MNDPNIRSSKVHDVSGIRRLFLKLLGWIVRKWQASLQYEFDIEADGFFSHSPKGSLLLLWHNRLFPGIGALNEVDLQGERLHALVSASRDGGQLSFFIRELGLIPIRGSSSRRGSVAARECVKVLKNGGHLAITVDGPRGPCYEPQQGAALLMQVTGADVNLVGVECESCWILNSWDKFILPVPFSRVKVKLDRCGTTLLGEGSDRETVRLSVQKRLMALTLDQHHQP